MFRASWRLWHLTIDLPSIATAISWEEDGKYCCARCLNSPTSILWQRSRMTEGITGGTEEVQVTFQADVEPVTGVGSKAMWAPRLHQLSVVDGVQVLHVTVNTGEGDKTDRDKAIGIARDLAAAL